MIDSGSDVGSDRPDEQPQPSRFERLAALHRQQCRLEAETLSELAAFAREYRAADRDRDHPRPDPLTSQRLAEAELGAWLRLSRQEIHHRLGEAMHLTADLPDTVQAMYRGELDLPRARIIHDVTSVLDRDTAREVEHRLLQRASRQTRAQLKRAAERAVATVDPNGLERRHAQRRTDRDVGMVPQLDGMAELFAVLPAEDAMRAWTRVESIARAMSGPEETRTLGQRRADVFAGLLTGAEAAAAGAPSEPARQAGCAAEIQVQVPVATLLGVNDRPAELLGFGPITAEQARAIAATGVWRRLLCDPDTGGVLDVGRAHYRPPAALAEHVRIRDGCCIFPGCMVPAQRCDLDHTVAWTDGGHTRRGNLAPLCRYHHPIKEHGGWQLHQYQPGAFRWISPAGKTYLTGREPPDSS